MLFKKLKDIKYTPLCCDTRILAMSSLLILTKVMTIMTFMLLMMFQD